MTVLRGPRGFGKTTSIVHVLSEHGDPVDLAYLTLDATARFAESFWRQLATLLHQLREQPRQSHADPIPPESDVREHCVALLRTWDEPLLIVIDNFHEAGLRDGAESIDHELIEALRVNPALEMVVATRSLRTLETTGSLSLDMQILRPQDLALTIEDVQHLATKRGLEVSIDQAAQLRAELGGWPAAIRGCLDAASVAGADAVVDSMLVDGYLTAMLDDIRSEALKEFLLRTAVPDEISEPVISAIAPGEGALSHLRSLIMGGLVHERMTPGGLRYAYAPAIRESILRYVHRTRPELEREVHRSLMPLAASEEGPIGVLRHAVAAQEWEAALEVLREEWTVLVSRHRWSLEELGKSFPRHLLAEKVRLQYLTQGMTAKSSRGDRITWSSAHPAFLDMAMALRAQDRPTDEDPVIIGFQAAVAAVLSGDNELAIAEFGKIREKGLATDDVGAQLLGSVGLVMGKAIHGEAREARALVRSDELATLAGNFPQEGLRDLAQVGLSIAYALASVDSVSEDMGEAVSRIVEPARRDELWGLAVAVRAMHASIVGDTTMRAHHGGAIRNALRHLDADGVTATTLGTVLAELQIKAGFSGAAEQVLFRHPPSGVRDGMLALLLAHSGQMSEALRVAETVLATSGITVRNVVMCGLVSSWALHSQGHHAAAARSFDNAMYAAQESGQRRPFHFLPVNVLRAVGSGHGLQELRPDLVPAGRSEQRAVHDFAGLALLSDREREVLAALRDHAGPTGISEALGISVNTVKTHLRNVYHKLDASSREEALWLTDGAQRSTSI